MMAAGLVAGRCQWQIRRGSARQWCGVSFGSLLQGALTGSNSQVSLFLDHQEHQLEYVSPQCKEHPQILCFFAEKDEETTLCSKQAKKKSDFRFTQMVFLNWKGQVPFHCQKQTKSYWTGWFHCCTGFMASSRAIGWPYTSPKQVWRLTGADFGFGDEVSVLFVFDMFPYNAFKWNEKNKVPI